MVNELLQTAVRLVRFVSALIKSWETWLALRRWTRHELKRPGYEVEYIRRYYNHEAMAEPACVLGFLQVFVLSSGDVLTGCYPLKPVGNILNDSLETILASEAYYNQSLAMLRRECPGCTCGVESSLAMKHSASSAIFELSQLITGQGGRKREEAMRVAPAETPSRPELPKQSENEPPESTHG